MLNRERGYSKSAYHMPCTAKGLQIDWEKWFTKLNSLLLQFELLDSDIIFAVTGHLDDNHPVMVGWSNKSDTILRSGRTVTLADFFNHARERLFSETCMRKQAWAMLKNMCHTACPDHEDARDVVAALEELFLRLFPRHQTNEQPPCTWREAVQIVYQMLIAVKNELPVNRQSTWFHRAWARYQYDSTEKFNKFLDPDLHAGKSEAESNALYSEFMADTYTCMRAAHRMYHVCTSSMDPLLTLGSGKTTVATTFLALPSEIADSNGTDQGADAGTNACEPQSVLALSVNADMNKRRKLEQALAAHPKARRTALSAALPAARQLPQPPLGYGDVSNNNNMPPPPAPAVNGGQGAGRGTGNAAGGARGGGRGRRGREGRGGGRGSGRAPSFDGNSTPRSNAQGGTYFDNNLEYFADSRRRKWTEAEFYQMEANAPVRARWASLAEVLGLPRTHNQCLEALSRHKCPICLGERHKYAENCSVFKANQTDRANEIQSYKKQWRAHCKEFNTIEAAVKGYPYAQLTYTEYPCPPPLDQVTTAPAAATTAAVSESALADTTNAPLSA